MFAVLLFALLACSAQPIQSTPTNNPEIKLELLFSEQGCAMYRFEDGGRSHYWARCAGAVESSWAEGCGKNCSRTVVEQIQATVVP